MRGAKRPVVDLREYIPSQKHRISAVENLAEGQQQKREIHLAKSRRDARVLVVIQLAVSKGRA